MTIQKFNKENIASIHSEIKNAMAEVEKKFNIKITQSRLSYDYFEFKVNIDFSLDSNEAIEKLNNIIKKQYNYFKEVSALSNIKLPEFNETFKTNEIDKTDKTGTRNRDAKIVDFKRKNHKYPIIFIYEDTPDVKYKASGIQISSMMKK